MIEGHRFLFGLICAVALRQPSATMDTVMMKRISV